MRNSDLLQSADLLALGDFVTGTRKLRCIGPPVLLGNVFTLAPYALYRALSAIEQKLGVAAAGRWAHGLIGRCIVLPHPAADVIIGHGLLPVPMPGAAPLLWGPGYMHDDFYEPPRSPEQKRVDNAQLREMTARVAAGIFLTTEDAVRRWNADIAVPAAPMVFAIPYFMPRSPRSHELPACTKSSNRIEILFVGREARRKNLPALIEALDRLGSTRAFRLTVVSDLRDGAVDLDREYIVHHRELPNSAVLALMEVSHVFAMVSRRESFGMVYVEALSRGCTVLAPQRAGQRDMLGDCALYADPNDVDSICSELSALLAGTGWSERAERAQQRYARRFAPDVVANAFHDAAARIVERC